MNSLIDSIHKERNSLLDGKKMDLEVHFLTKNSC